MIPAGSGRVTTLKEATHEQVKTEEDHGASEEREEMIRADAETSQGVTPMARTESEEQSKRIVKPDDQNALASLRQGSGDTIHPAPGIRKKRTQGEKETARRERSERLAVKLKEVFGLPEAEELLVEMPCWLLRNLRKSLPTFACEYRS